MFESFRSIFNSVYDGSDIEREERLMMLQRVSKLFPGKELADPVTEYAASHAPVLLGSNILLQLFLDGVEVKEGFPAQTTWLGWVVSGKAGQPPQKPLPHIL